MATQHEWRVGGDSGKGGRGCRGSCMRPVGLLTVVWPCTSGPRQLKPSAKSAGRGRAALGQLPVPSPACTIRIIPHINTEYNEMVNSL